ncbi:MAG TPA: DUF4340 domain-containing protein [Phycisphaerales bacterium]|mgnify:CR=1 FL=1|nr:DUF4340 domain-containing protein [Phycisphaerales bacterium]
MNNKNLAILVMVAIIMVAIAVSLSNRVNKPSATAVEGDLIQGLDPAVIGAIVLGGGDEFTTLRRAGRGFVVAEKDNYPAKLGAINDLLSNCLKVRTTGLFTSNPDHFADLEVTEDKARTVVKFLRAEPNEPILTGLIIGKNLEKGDGSYVRLLAADAQASNNVYIATDTPWISTDAGQYLDKDITSFDRKEIAAVTVTDINAVSYTLQRADPNSDTIVLSSTPEGKKLKTSDAESTFNAMTSLRFDDVARDDGGFTFDRVYICRLKNQTVYRIRLARKGDKTYASCTATYTGEVPTDARTESDEQMKEKEAKLLAHDNASKFAQQHQGWVYEIPSYKANYLTRSLDELLEDLAKPGEPNEPAADVISDADLASPAETSATAETAEPDEEPVQAPEPNQPAAADPNASKP